MMIFRRRKPKSEPEPLHPDRREGPSMALEKAAAELAAVVAEAIAFYGPRRS